MKTYNEIEKDISELRRALWAGHSAVNPFPVDRIIYQVTEEEWKSIETHLAPGYPMNEISLHGIRIMKVRRGS